jgi:hypothetical protein
MHGETAHAATEAVSEAGQARGYGDVRVREVDVRAALWQFRA